MEQLKVGTNDLPSVAKKKVVAVVASVLSTEAFPTAGIALQLEVLTAAMASIPSRKVGEECWNSGLNGRLEEEVASIHLKAVVASIQLEGSGGGHVGGCSDAGDPPHGITSIGPLWESYNIQV
jgi:hypothetical protein